MQEEQRGYHGAKQNKSMWGPMLMSGMPGYRLCREAISAQKGVKGLIT